jgi:hypothetical protein
MELSIGGLKHRCHEAAYLKEVGEINEHLLVRLLTTAGDVEADCCDAFGPASLDEVIGNSQLEDLIGGVRDGLRNIQT